MIDILGDEQVAAVQRLTMIEDAMLDFSRSLIGMSSCLMHCTGTWSGMQAMRNASDAVETRHTSSGTLRKHLAASKLDKFSRAVKDD